MPKRIEELRGCPTKRPATTEERLKYRDQQIREARRKALEWRKKQDARQAFNRDQYLASELNI